MKTTNNLKPETANPRRSGGWLRRLVRRMVKCLPLTFNQKCNVLIESRILQLKLIFKLRILNLHFRLLVNKILFSFRIALHKFVNIFLKFDKRMLQLRYSFIVFIHNLILYYRNHDGDEPPNEKS